MATNGMISPNGMIPNAKRISWKSRYGNLTAMLEGAREELLQGQLENAWTAYQLALAQCLRQRWIVLSGKPNSTVTCPNELIRKIQSRGDIDAWTLKVFLEITKRPTPVEFRHVDVFAAFVESLASAWGGQL